MNYILCIISIGLICAYIYTILTCTKCPPFIDYEMSLNNKQKIIYENVVKERMKLFIEGLFIGLLIGLTYLYFHYKSIISGCIFSIIVIGIQIIYYTIMPKSTYMLQNLENKNQINNWLKVYKEMQYRFIFGFIIGIIGFNILLISLN